MNIAGEDFSHVLDLAARDAGWDSIEAQSQAFDAARGWLADNTGLVETWIARPRYADVDALLYRSLLTFLSGGEGYEPADNSTLLYVIAAGETWDELPTHAKLAPKFVYMDSEGETAREIPCGDIYDLAALADGVY